MTDHHAEINAQAQAYLEELHAAAAAAHERLKAGVMRLQPQMQVDDAPPLVDFEDETLREADPIFSTREFDVPPQALGGLVDLDSLES
ncbi:MAG TPA: hypothetical protein VJP85_07395 [Candidatus Baltobacteraceae bacterium]|nr:hypothetical protein [Candidatus Baltobacteraceae bacterium]